MIYINDFYQSSVSLDNMIANIAVGTSPDTLQRDDAIQLDMACLDKKRIMGARYIIQNI